MNLISKCVTKQTGKDTYDMCVLAKIRELQMLHISPDSQNEFLGMTWVFTRVSNGESLQLVSNGRVLEHVEEERADLLTCDKHAEMFKTKVGRKLLALHASYGEADLPHGVPILEVGMPS